MFERISVNMKGILGTIASSTGAITAWQDQVEWAFRMGAATVSIVVGVLTIRSLLRKAKREGKE